MLGRGTVVLVQDARPSYSKLELDVRPKLVIAKDIKVFTYCCYVRCATSIVGVGIMSWYQTGATHYHGQLGFPDKVHAMKGLVVCYVVWLGSMIYELFLRTSERCVVWPLVVFRMAIKPIDTCRYNTIE